MSPLVLPPAELLSPEEQAAAGRFRHAQRRREWIAARALAKELLKEAGLVPADAALRRVSILPRDSAASLRPRPTLDGRPLPGDLSLSHAGGWVAVALSAGPRVGVDIVQPGEVRDDRLAVWLSHTERHLAGEEGLRLSELWAMKEAAYKATSEGQPFRPADFPVAAERGWTCGACSVVLQPAGTISLALASPDRELLRDRERLRVRRRRLDALTPESA